MPLVERTPGTLWRDCGDRVVLLPPDASDPIVINALGRLIWLHLNVPADPDALEHAIAAETDPAEPDAVAAAARQLIESAVLRWVP
jgi:hypothetical protein